MLELRVSSLRGGIVISLYITFSCWHWFYLFICPSTPPPPPPPSEKITHHPRLTNNKNSTWTNNHHAPLPPPKKKNTHTHTSPTSNLTTWPNLNLTCTKLRHCWCHCAFFMTLKVFPSNLWGQVGGHKPWQAFKASSASSRGWRVTGNSWVSLGFFSKGPNNRYSL